MTVTCVNDAPVADDETFNGDDSAIGNTTLVVNDPTTARRDARSDGYRARTDRPHKTITGDILAGDTDIDGPGPLTVTPGTFATDDGGSVTIAGRRRLHVRPGRRRRAAPTRATSSTTPSQTRTPPARARRPAPTPGA